MPQSGVTDIAWLLFCSCHQCKASVLHEEDALSTSFLNPSRHLIETSRTRDASFFKPPHVAVKVKCNSSGNRVVTSTCLMVLGAQESVLWSQLDQLCTDVKPDRSTCDPSGALGNQSVCTTANANCILWSLLWTGHLENMALWFRYYLKSDFQ